MIAKRWASVTNNRSEMDTEDDSSEDCLFDEREEKDLQDALRGSIQDVRPPQPELEEVEEEVEEEKGHRHEKTTLDGLGKNSFVLPNVNEVIKNSFETNEAMERIGSGACAEIALEGNLSDQKNDFGDALTRRLFESLDNVHTSSWHSTMPAARRENLSKILPEHFDILADELGVKSLQLKNFAGVNEDYTWSLVLNTSIRVRDVYYTPPVHHEKMADGCMRSMYGTPESIHRQGSRYVGSLEYVLEGCTSMRLIRSLTRTSEKSGRKDASSYVDFGVLRCKNSEDSPGNGWMNDFVNVFESLETNENGGRVVKQRRSRAQRGSTQDGEEDTSSSPKGVVRIYPYKLFSSPGERTRVPEGYKEWKNVCRRLNRQFRYDRHKPGPIPFYMLLSPNDGAWPSLGKLIVARDSLFMHTPGSDVDIGEMKKKLEELVYGPGFFSNSVGVSPRGYPIRVGVIPFSFATQMELPIMVGSILCPTSADFHQCINKCAQKKRDSDDSRGHGRRINSEEIDQVLHVRERKTAENQSVPITPKFNLRIFRRLDSKIGRTPYRPNVMYFVFELVRYFETLHGMTYDQVLEAIVTRGPKYTHELLARIKALLHSDDIEKRNEEYWGALEELEKIEKDDAPPSESEDELRDAERHFRSYMPDQGIPGPRSVSKGKDGLDACDPRPNDEVADAIMDAVDGTYRNSMNGSRKELMGYLHKVVRMMRSKTLNHDLTTWSPLENVPMMGVWSDPEQHTDRDGTRITRTVNVDPSTLGTCPYDWGSFFTDGRTSRFVKIQNQTAPNQEAKHIPRKDDNPDTDDKRAHVTIYSRDSGTYNRGTSTTISINDSEKKNVGMWAIMVQFYQKSVEVDIVTILRALGVKSGFMRLLAAKGNVGAKHDNDVVFDVEYRRVVLNALTSQYDRDEIREELNGPIRILNVSEFVGDTESRQFMALAKILLLADPEYAKKFKHTFGEAAEERGMKKTEANRRDALSRRAIAEKNFVRRMVEEHGPSVVINAHQRLVSNFLPNLNPTPEFRDSSMGDRFNRQHRIVYEMAYLVQRLMAIHLGREGETQFYDPDSRTQMMAGGNFVETIESVFVNSLRIAENMTVHNRIEDWKKAPGQDIRRWADMGSLLTSAITGFIRKGESRGYTQAKGLTGPCREYNTHIANHESRTTDSIVQDRRSRDVRPRITRGKSAGFFDPYATQEGEGIGLKNTLGALAQISHSRVQGLVLTVHRIILGATISYMDRMGIKEEFFRAQFKESLYRNFLFETETGRVPFHFSAIESVRGKTKDDECTEYPFSGIDDEWVSVRVDSVRIGVVRNIPELVGTITENVWYLKRMLHRYVLDDNEWVTRNVVDTQLRLHPPKQGDMYIEEKRSYATERFGMVLPVEFEEDKSGAKVPASVDKKRVSALWHVPLYPKRQFAFHREHFWDPSVFTDPMRRDMHLAARNVTIGLEQETNMLYIDSTSGRLVLPHRPVAQRVMILWNKEETGELATRVTHGLESELQRMNPRLGAFHGVQDSEPLWKLVKDHLKEVADIERGDDWVVYAGLNGPVEQQCHFWDSDPGKVESEFKRVLGRRVMLTVRSRGDSITVYLHRLHTYEADTVAPIASKVNIPQDKLATAVAKGLTCFYSEFGGTHLRDPSKLPSDDPDRVNQQWAFLDVYMKEKTETFAVRRNILGEFERCMEQNGVFLDYEDTLPKDYGPGAETNPLRMKVVNIAVTIPIRYPRGATKDMYELYKRAAYACNQVRKSPDEVFGKEMWSRVILDKGAESEPDRRLLESSVCNGMAEEVPMLRMNRYMVNDFSDRLDQDFTNNVVKRSDYGRNMWHAPKEKKIPLGVYPWSACRADAFARTAANGRGALGLSFSNFHELGAKPLSVQENRSLKENARSEMSRTLESLCRRTEFNQEHIPLSLDCLIMEGLVTMCTQRQLEGTTVSSSFETLGRNGWAFKPPYPSHGYMMVDPELMLSETSTVSPYPNRKQGPRNTYGKNQRHAGISLRRCTEYTFTPTNYFTGPVLFRNPVMNTTEIMTVLRHFPLGIPVVEASMCGYGDTIEDALAVSPGLNHSGVMTVYKQYRSFADIAGMSRINPRTGAQVELSGLIGSYAVPKLPQISSFHQDVQREIENIVLAQHHGQEDRQIRAMHSLYQKEPLQYLLYNLYTMISDKVARKLMMHPIQTLRFVEKTSYYKELGNMLRDLTPRPEDRSVDESYIRQVKHNIKVLLEFLEKYSFVEEGTEIHGGDPIAVTYSIRTNLQSDTDRQSEAEHQPIAQIGRSSKFTNDSGLVGDEYLRNFQSIASGYKKPASRKRSRKVMIYDFDDLHQESDEDEDEGEDEDEESDEDEEGKEAGSGQEEKNTEILQKLLAEYNQYTHQQRASLLASIRETEGADDIQKYLKENSTRVDSAQETLSRSEQTVDQLLGMAQPSVGEDSDTGRSQLKTVEIKDRIIKAPITVSGIVNHVSIVKTTPAERMGGRSSGNQNEDHSYNMTDNVRLVYEVLKTKIPERGDKYSTFHGQKGVQGDPDDGVVGPTGYVPGAMRNSHALPARMTRSQSDESRRAFRFVMFPHDGRLVWDGSTETVRDVLETEMRDAQDKNLRGVIGTRRFTRRAASALVVHPTWKSAAGHMLDLDRLIDVEEGLAASGRTFERRGRKESLPRPWAFDEFRITYTGQKMSRPCVGIIKLFRLNHISSEKDNSRGHDSNVGANDPVTNQAPSGRSNEGGRRSGEQERWAMGAHGVSHTHYEITSVNGNDQVYVYCASCNTQAFIVDNRKDDVKNHDKMSSIKKNIMAEVPMSAAYARAHVHTISNRIQAGDFKVYCPSCMGSGREFKLVRYPGSMQAFIDERQTQGIRIKVVSHPLKN